MGSTTSFAQLRVCLAVLSEETFNRTMHTFTRHLPTDTTLYCSQTAVGVRNPMGLTRRSRRLPYRDWYGTKTGRSSKVGLTNALLIIWGVGWN